MVRYAAALGAAAALLAAGPAPAQIPLSPRALGMGGAYVASARGFESIFFNPANLGLPDTPAWSLAFPQITVGASVLGPKVTDLDDFLNYDDLDETDQQRLLGEIPAGGTSMDVDVRAPIFALQVGRFAVGVAYGLMGEHTLDRDLVELFFEGYEQGRTSYGIRDTRGESASFWDFSAGYGHSFGPVSVGVAGHFYLGQKLMQTRASAPRFGILNRTISVDYVGVSSEGGTGYGLDLGAALTPLPGVTLSAAVSNLVSSMDWDRELTGRIVTLTERDFEDSELSQLQDRYEESERELGETPPAPYAQVATGLLDEREMPTTLRLGAAFSPLPQVEIGASFQDNLSNGRLAGRWDRLLGAGIQLRLPVVSLRAGASTNLDEGTLLGAGLRLGVVDIAVARFSTQGVLDPEADRDGLAASFSVNVRTGALAR